MKTCLLLKKFLLEIWILRHSCRSGALQENSTFPAELQVCSWFWQSQTYKYICNSWFLRKHFCHHFSAVTSSIYLPFSLFWPLNILLRSLGEEKQNDKNENFPIRKSYTCLLMMSTFFVGYWVAIILIFVAIIVILIVPFNGKGV